MFIKDLYDLDVKKINEDKGYTFRTANVGWASEGLVSLPMFNVGLCQREFSLKHPIKISLFIKPQIAPNVNI